jgi:hypothetical protein
VRHAIAGEDRAMQCVILAAALVVLLLLVFWLRQFIVLMALPDSVFPGRYDKTLWFVLFLAGGFLGPTAFWLYGIARRAAMRLAAEEVARQSDMGSADYDEGIKQ